MLRCAGADAHARAMGVDACLQSYRRRVMAPEESSELRRTGSFRSTSSPEMPDYRLPRRSTDASVVDLEAAVHQVGSRLSRRGTSSVEAAVSGTARRSVPFAADEDDDDNFVYATPSPKLGPSSSGGLPSNSSAAAAAAVGGARLQQNARDLDFIEQASQRLFGLTKEPLPIERRIKQRVKPAVTVLQKFLRHVMFESIWLILILLGSGMSIFHNGVPSSACMLLLLLLLIIIILLGVLGLLVLLCGRFFIFIVIHSDVSSFGINKGGLEEEQHCERDESDERGAHRAPGQPGRSEGERWRPRLPRGPW